VATARTETWLLQAAGARIADLPAAALVRGTGAPCIAGAGHPKHVFRLKVESVDDPMTTRPLDHSLPVYKM